MAFAAAVFRKHRLSPILATVAILATALALAAPAEAAFPGANGKIAFVRGGDIYTVNSDGTGEANLTNSPSSPEIEPAWSPDGTNITFTSNPFTSNSTIYTMNADGTGAMALRPRAGGPAWSPDGREIVYLTLMHLEIINSDGSGAPRQLTPPNDTLGPDNPAWSPDGQKIAFDECTDADSECPHYDLYLINPDGTEKSFLRRDSREPNWSPNGEDHVRIRRIPVWDLCGQSRWHECDEDR